MNAAILPLSESHMHTAAPINQRLLPAAILARLATTPDEATWNALVEQVGDDIHRVARRLTGDATLADDVRQECLITVLHNAERFVPPAFGADAAARAWVLRIAAHIAMRLARSRSRLRQREQYVVVEETAPGPGPDEHVQRDETAALVRAGLAEIPEHQRAAVILHHMEGLEFATIAQAVGCPTATVRVRAHRGLEQLRQILGRRGLVLTIPLLIGALNELPAATETTVATAPIFQVANAATLEPRSYPPAAPLLEIPPARRIAAVILLGTMLALAAGKLANAGGQTTDQKPPPVVSPAGAVRPAIVATNQHQATAQPTVVTAKGYQGRMCMFERSLGGSREAFRKAGIDPKLERQILPADTVRQICAAAGDSAPHPEWFDDLHRVAHGMISPSPSNVLDGQLHGGSSLIFGAVPGGDMVVEEAELHERLKQMAVTAAAHNAHELVLVERQASGRYAINRQPGMNGTFTTDGGAYEYAYPTQDLVVIGNFDRTMIDPQIPNVTMLNVDQALVIKAAPQPGEEDIQRMVVIYADVVSDKPEAPQTTPASMPEVAPEAPKEHA